MPELNANIPQLFNGTYVRSEFLYDLRSHHDEFTPATVFGVRSLQGRALGFHILTDVGACVWNVPIHALVHLPVDVTGPDREHFLQSIPATPRVDEVQLWDCFGSKLAVTVFEHLDGLRAQALLKSGAKEIGRYRFTIDWWGTEYADNPGDLGHKCAHLLALDDGRYCALPNNRILFADPASIVAPFAKIPDYKTNTRVWQCEDGTRWRTEDSDRMFYGVNDVSERRASTKSSSVGRTVTDGHGQEVIAGHASVAEQVASNGASTRAGLLGGVADFDAGDEV